MSDTPIFAFDNSYARDLKGFYVPWQGDKTPAPKLLRLNHILAQELGLDVDMLEGPDGAAILTGAVTPDGGAALAMAYAGHQFGGFSQQLGDGRAMLVGEVIDAEGRRRDIHLKGSGRTPFSRGGDGKAVLGPVLREYLIGEAMHALGIPTTRALAASLTGEEVMRERPEQGAVLARVATSHLRVGTFQFFAARSEAEKVRRLADYAIDRHFPDIMQGPEKQDPNRYLEFFRRVRDVQAALVARWVLVGFVHGVMNTDNTTISGETIDYGPCAFIDNYDPKAVFSSIDKQGRYAYGNQPPIIQWNLSRFAETLIDLVNPDDSDDAVRQLTNEINAFPARYQQEWLKGMRLKLGLTLDQESDLDLVNDLHAAMQGQNVDFTQFFRSLSDVARGDTGPARALFDTPETAFDDWLDRYVNRLAQEDIDGKSRSLAMDQVNPLYIPRNHKVEEALAAARAGDMAPFDRLLEVLSRPFEAQSDAEDYAKPAPASFGPYETFCGT
ncbi:MAG: YdiU family protein [Rhizobiales bacterium]|nr:YdiU family protein [Hyphomicrobiales bacterium]